MIRSMTGYGQAVSETDMYLVSVEMRSVNHRFLEISIRLPREFLFLEEVVRKKIGEQVKRGKLDVYVVLERKNGKQKKISVDLEMAEQYAAAFNKLKEHLSLAECVLNPTELIGFPDILQVEEAHLNPKEMVDPVLSSVESACQQLVHMRKSEGKALLEDLTGKISLIQNVIEEIQLREPIVVQHYRERLTLRMKDLLGGETDEERIMMEAALFAEKANIDEELVRLTSHCKQFITIASSLEPIGRKLDFLVQEMNREVNTIGSKANDIEISRKVVDLKAELEKIKEQVQNIE